MPPLCAWSPSTFREKRQHLVRSSTPAGGGGCWPTVVPLEAKGPVCPHPSILTKQTPRASWKGKRSHKTVAFSLKGLEKVGWQGALWGEGEGWGVPAGCVHVPGISHIIRKLLSSLAQMLAIVKIPFLCPPKGTHHSLTFEGLEGTGAVQVLSEGSKNNKRCHLFIHSFVHLPHVDCILCGPGLQEGTWQVRAPLSWNRPSRVMAER